MAAMPPNQAGKRQLIGPDRPMGELPRPGCVRKKASPQI